MVEGQRMPLSLSLIHIYPDIWYRQYGGAKPSWPDTYEEAKEQNLLTWSES